MRPLLAAGIFSRSIGTSTSLYCGSAGESCVTALMVSFGPAGSACAKAIAGATSSSPRILICLLPELLLNLAARNPAQRMPAVLRVGPDLRAPAADLDRLRPGVAREHLGALQLVDRAVLGLVV